MMKAAAKEHAKTTLIIAAVFFDSSILKVILSVVCISFINKLNNVIYTRTNGIIWWTPDPSLAVARIRRIVTRRVEIINA